EDERVLRSRRNAGTNRLTPACPARDDLAGLPAAQLLGEQDDRFLPALGRDNHDRVDPRGCFEAFQALGQQRAAAQRGKGLGTIEAEPLAASCSDENRGDTHARAATLD